MSDTHLLKSHPEPFRQVVSGEKRYEFRKKDRDFKVDDCLELQEWDPETERYTGATFTVEVTHITEGGRFAIPEGYCIMSIRVPLTDDEVKAINAVYYMLREKYDHQVDLDHPELANIHADRMIKMNAIMRKLGLVTRFPDPHVFDLSKR